MTCPSGRARTMAPLCCHEDQTSCWSDEGGYVVAAGIRERVARKEHSFTGQFLRKVEKS